MTAYLLPFKEVLSDVKLVGKRKAIGYLSYFARRQSLFVVPMQEEELADIADELTARGMEVYWDPVDRTTGRVLVSQHGVCQRLLLCRV